MKKTCFLKERMVNILCETDGIWFRRTWRNGISEPGIHAWRKRYSEIEDVKLLAEGDPEIKRRKRLDETMMSA
jgi:hypothetical protein